MYLVTPQSSTEFHGTSINLIPATWLLFIQLKNLMYHLTCTLQNHSVTLDFAPIPIRPTQRSDSKCVYNTKCSATINYNIIIFILNIY